MTNNLKFAVQNMACQAKFLDNIFPQCPTLLHILLGFLVSEINSGKKLMTFRTCTLNINMKTSIIKHSSVCKSSISTE